MKLHVKGSRDGRDADLEHLRTVKPKNALQAKKMKEAGEAIRKQRMDRYVTDAREAMIKAYRAEEYEDAKGVSDDLLKHRDGKNLGRIGLNISAERYREIFGHD